VHAGHVAFALQAIETAKLDMVYFLPERQPRHKTGVEHFAHRVAMLKRAARPYSRFDVLELDDVNFTPERTLAKLRRKFGLNQLVFLFGSDVVASMPEWPKVERLLQENELVIGLRDHNNRPAVERQIDTWPIEPRAVKIFASYAPDVSSGRVREALRRRSHTRGLLASVRRYSDHNWLYVSLA